MNLFCVADFLRKNLEIFRPCVHNDNRCEVYTKMDVYGYNAYLYNRSDELAKQMYAQQALSTYNRPAEPHAMPEPSGAPWNAGQLSWGLPSPPQLVQFTGQPLEPQPGPSYLNYAHCVQRKRKSLDVEPAV